MRVLALALFACLPIGVAADVSAPKWRALPWHLVDVYHRYPDTGTFRSVEVDMELSGQVPGGSFLYLSPLWGKFGDTGFYFGFVSDLYSRQQKRIVGKGMIFSRWGAGTLDDARLPTTSWGFIGEKETSGEGDFVSVRQPFSWSEGRYTFVMRKRRPTPSGGASWLDLLIFEHQTGKWFDGGGLRFRNPSLKLKPTLVNFVEVFAPWGKGRWAFPTSLPNLTVTMGPPLINGIYEPVSSRRKRNPSVPPLVELSDVGGELRVRLGTLPVPVAPNTKTLAR